MALAFDAQPDEQDLAQEQEKLRRAEKLVRMLKAEEEDALGYAETEVAAQQMEALRRYFGELYGDEEDGRSQVVTREVFETIEWTRPDLMRVFSSGKNVVELIESSPEDSRYADDVAKYLQWIFWEDNPGFENLDDFAFDGLLQRRGYIACYWEDKEYRAPQTLTGLNDEQVMMLSQDPTLEIVGWDENASEAGGLNLTVRKLKSPARAVIETFAPEDVRLNGRALHIDKNRYVGIVRRWMRGDVARRFPDMAEEIREYSGGAGNSVTMRSEDVRQERFQDDDFDWKSTGDEASEELEVFEEYLRVDLNGDGYPELIRSYRLGDLLLEETEVDENPLASWTPIRIPHRFQGMSLEENTRDLQRQSTVITRAGLDALYQSVVNREAYDATKVDVESLLATYSGAKVAVQGSPGDAIMPLTGGLDTATNAWNALEIIKQRLEDRTGATRQTRGLDSDQLTSEHSGAALRQLNVNADARKEMMARNMASGLGDFFSKLYRLVCRNQNEARQVKVGGKWCQFDPRTWNSDLRVRIQAGGMNREQSLVGLQMIGAEQDKILDALGPMNPNVTPANRYNYQEELCRQAGFQSCTQFFTEVPPDWQPPPQEDPAMAKVKVDAEAQKAKLEMEGQKTQAQMQLQSQKDAAQLESDRQKAALDLELAREKAAAEMELARQKAAAEMALAREKAQQEAQLAREQMLIEAELERERISSQERVGLEKAKSDAKLSKNRPGGSLSE